MNILIPTYNYMPECYGGTESYVYELTKWLSQKGVHCTIVCGSKNNINTKYRFYVQKYTYQSIPVYKVCLNGRFFSLRELYTNEASDLETYWYRWLLKRDFDLVHFNGYSLVASNSLMKVAKKLGLPILFTFHHPPVICLNGKLVTCKNNICKERLEVEKCIKCWIAKNGILLSTLISKFPILWAQLVEQFINSFQFPYSKIFTLLQLHWLVKERFRAWEDMVKMIDCWHTFSNYFKELLTHNGVKENKIVVYSHGIEPFVLNKKPSPKIRFGFIGRFHFTKGMDVLYEALKRVHKKLDAEFLIFGDAQSKEERLIKKKMISLAKKDTRIKLLGSFERNKISHILSQIDVLIVPSVFVETGPLTVLEAFLAKVPVIGSNLPGISEYIKDEVNGLLFEMGNSLELSLCIQRICKEKELLERLKRGIDRVKSIYEHTQEIISVYKKLLRK